MPAGIARLALLYGTLDASFRSFKALRKQQRLVKAVEEHNAGLPKGSAPLDPQSVLDKLDRQDVVPLLQLWTVVAMVYVYDAYLDNFLSWIPFYTFVKLAVLLWIFAPQTRGGVIAFETFLAPAVEKRLKWFNAEVLPKIVGTIFSATHSAHATVLAQTLKSVSDKELSETEDSLNRLLRHIVREDYSRRREESLAAMREAVPDEKQRVALLDDILREYDDERPNGKPYPKRAIAKRGAPENNTLPSDDEYDSGDSDDDGWTELRLEKASDEFHLRFASDVESDEEFEDATVNDI